MNNSSSIPYQISNSSSFSLSSFPSSSTSIISPSSSSSSSITNTTINTNNDNNNDNDNNNNNNSIISMNITNNSTTTTNTSSRYENQKRRDWNTFGQYLRNHRPPLSLNRCSGAHVLEFLRYLDQFGKTKVHIQACPFYGHPNPPAPCPCPLRQAWGSLDALIGRLRAAYEENGGKPETNPFGARAVRLYLREVRDTQSKARGISYEKKKRRRVAPPPPPLPPSCEAVPQLSPPLQPPGAG
ncbi:hypothetical protein vseg_003280 [Gypsophila vaccaria]